MSSLSDCLHFRALSFKSNKSGRSQQFFKIGLLKNYRFLFTFKVTLGATLNSSRIASNNSFKTAFANAFRFNSSINLFIVSVRIKQNTFVSSAVELFRCFLFFTASITGFLTCTIRVFFNVISCRTDFSPLYCFLVPQKQNKLSLLSFRVSD